MTSSVTKICIVGKLEYLLNKKRYHKKKNAILLYFEKRIFEMTYFSSHMHFKVEWYPIYEPKSLFKFGEKKTNCVLLHSWTENDEMVAMWTTHSLLR